MQWADAVEAHQRDTREAILDATGAVVSSHGLPAVTVDLIAAKAGVTVARLHRLFPDLDSLLHAWHDRQVGNHLAFVAEVGDQPGDVAQRLDAVFRAYAAIMYQTHEHRATPRGASLHRDEHLVHARRHLREVIAGLIAEGARTGELRDDLPADALADQCVRTLSTAGDHTSAGAIRQLVTDTLAGLRR
jgi:AcrR family transcriptional regulator